MNIIEKFNIIEESIDDFNDIYQELDLDKFAKCTKISDTKLSIFKKNETKRPLLEILKSLKFQEKITHFTVHNLSDRPIAFRFLLHHEIVDNYIFRPNAGIIAIYDTIKVEVVERFEKIDKFFIDIEVCICPCKITEEFKELVTDMTTCENYKRQKDIVKNYKFTHNYRVLVL